MPDNNEKSRDEKLSIQPKNETEPATNAHEESTSTPPEAQDK